MPPPHPRWSDEGMASTPHIYVDCDVPDGMTLTEWRRSQCAGRTGRRAPFWRRLLALA
jgi:hypothetical protein